MTHTHVDEPAGVPDPSGPGGLVRLRLDVAYDGAGFHGWARQPGQRTVQAELEAALRAVVRVPASVPVRVAVAGRTDAGVHAIGQVCHADVPAASLGSSPTSAPTSLSSSAPPLPESGGLLGQVRQQPSRFGEGGGAGDGNGDVEGGGMRVLRRRLNGLLAADVQVREVTIAPDGFDARWSALWRRYTYLVADEAAGRDPRTRGHVLWHPRPLSVDTMAAAAAPFLGEHDFAAFCRARPDASTVRTIQSIGWHRRDDGVVAFDVRADAFCHSMVRALVGAFLAVGAGRWPVEQPASLLAAGVRVSSIATAPPHGLTLVEVGYPPDDGLAAQAQRAKRWRGSGCPAADPAV